MTLNSPVAPVKLALSIGTVSACSQLSLRLLIRRGRRYTDMLCRCRRKIVGVDSLRTFLPAPRQNMAFSDAHTNCGLDSASNPGGAFKITSSDSSRPCTDITPDVNARTENDQRTQKAAGWNGIKRETEAVRLSSDRTSFQSSFAPKAHPVSDNSIMMFSRPLVLAFTAMPLLAAATPVDIKARGDGSCSTGPVQCCNTTATVR